MTDLATRLILAAFILTLVFAYPLSTSPGSVAIDLGPDTRLFLWTLDWDVHALTTLGGAHEDAARQRTAQPLRRP